MGVRSSQPRSPNLNKTDGHLLEYFRQNFGAGGGANSAPSVVLSGMTASGGIINDYSSGPSIYRAHIFTSSGTFDVSAIGDFGATIEYLVIAGGGGGGGQHGGGGGAGGLRTNLSGHPLAGAPFPVSTSPGSYTVTVGGGGVGQEGSSSYPYTKNSTSGSNSVFGPITSHGGGTGGNWSNEDGFSQDRQKGSTGGSGGGSGSNEA